jgi:rare lipoprotein A
LPLPTYVRVKNLRNDKVIVVRVNDRGPFVHNRVIDLSYAAAMKLDMIRDGTSLVEVTVISFDSDSGHDGDRPTRASTPAGPPATSSNGAGSHRIFVQVGAFGDRDNAARLLAMLTQSGIGNVFIHEDQSTRPTLYRVRVGPVAGVSQYDRLVEELESLGIKDPYLIAE